MIREASLEDKGDLEAILRILNSYSEGVMGMEEPLPEEVILRLPDELARQPGLLSLLAFDGEEAVGLVNGFYGFSTFQACKVLNIHDLAVEPAFRNRGVGRALLEAAEERAKEVGCCRVTLEVRSDNPARKLYERYGFEYGDPPMYFMAKELE